MELHGIDFMVAERNYILPPFCVVELSLLLSHSEAIKHNTR